MNVFRTHTCNELTINNIEENVTVSGWVDTIRDHGGIIFIDLRDHYGKTQVVVHDLDLVKGITKETVIKCSGKVVKRDEVNINKKIITGEIEIYCDAIEFLSDPSLVLPFEISDSKLVKEDVRLKYRYLDLRNNKMQENIKVRSKVFSFLRSKMESLGFLEVTTPILTSSSPEGAREFLIPSRKHKGKFYVLPQAPQQFKQLLMVSGVDKYFQIAPCFRDEDGRSDRLIGEFYQLDMELAFATQEDVLKVAEDVYPALFKEFGSREVTKGKFLRIPYMESLLKYGTDKPDLTNPLIIEDLTNYFSDVDFPVFKGKPVRAIVTSNMDDKPRSFYDSMLNYALSIGMKGLGYIEVKEDNLFKGPIAKFLTDDKKQELIKLLDLKESDVLFFICDDISVINKNSGLIRTKLANMLDIIDNTKFEFCIITDFPMYELNNGKIDFMHNPFSMPRGGMDSLINKDPFDIFADQYDVICNGVELVSGAVRNNRPEVLVKAFEIAGYSEDIVTNKFGALYEAFKYGAPPHAGMALGIDRAIMMIQEEDNIREVCAFPLTQAGEDPLTGAPTQITEQQLREVHIKLR